MAGRLMQRLDVLERERVRGFDGYAVIDLWNGQTLERAQADWIAENGPLGNRQWVLFGFGPQVQPCS
jgi:hypothetical protein